MITVVVRAERGVEALAVTLAALVPGAAAGLVADAVVLASAERDEVARLADAAGAAFVVAPRDASGWRAGAAVARREWLWLLSDGDVPGEGWIRAVGSFVDLAPLDGRALGRPSRRPLPLRARLEQLVEGRMGIRRVRAGDLVRRDLLAAPAVKLRPFPLAATIERDPAFG